MNGYPQPLVLYASQTGNAESIAKIIVRDLESKCNLKPRIQTLNDYTKEDKEVRFTRNKKYLFLSLDWYTTIKN